MTTPAEKPPIEVLREIISCESDVKRVVRLIENGGGRFTYLIETPFTTFPKFVIGTTDAEFNDVRIKSRCGLETAEEAWLRITDPDGAAEDAP